MLGKGIAMIRIKICDIYSFLTTLKKNKHCRVYKKKGIYINATSKSIYEWPH